MLLQLITLFLGWIKPKRVNFYNWTKLENLTTKINKAVETEITKFPQFVMEYVSTALHIPVFVLSRLPWWATLSLFLFAQQANTPTKIPLLISNNQIKQKSLSWDYEGRSWNYWSHLFAKEYGWTLEYIKNLDVDTALAHIQEIFTDEQLEQEFMWQMSEIAYPYNKTTKESKFSPLPRPYFMQMQAPEPKKIRMLKTLVPVGEVHDQSGMEKYFKEKAESEATQLARNGGSLEDM